VKLTIATRGPKIGQCNICGESGPLTEDHTPPKGCYRPTQVEIQSLLRRLSATAQAPKSRFSQNGVKYRTLCKHCNNHHLGKNYDPHFIEFVNQACTLLKSTLVLPPSLAITGRPQAIMRSLLGHLAAQGVARYRKGPQTEAIRDYIRDTSLPLPGSLHIYYWAYPHRSHVMVRDAAYVDLAADANPFAIWFLKFFPVAFMVAWEKPASLPYPVQTFDPWRSAPYEAQVDLPFQLHPLPPEYWPEAPTDHSVLAFGREAISVRSAG
jgi:hypothetical protein